MSKLAQKGRCLGVTTATGEDKLCIESFSMTERMSQLFALQVDMISEDRDVKPESIIGKPVTSQCARIFASINIDKGCGLISICSSVPSS